MTGPGRAGTHEAVIYSSDEELLSIAVPFLADGLANGGLTILAVVPAVERLLRDVLLEFDDLTVVARGEAYDRPLATLREFQRQFAEHAAAGAGRVRVLGHVPHPGLGVAWRPWVRYELGVGQVLTDFDVWGMCLYDARDTPEDVLADVRRTHPTLAGPGGTSGPNPAYVEPAQFLAEVVRRERDPIELQPPVLDLVDLAPAAARAAVRRLIRGSGLDAEAVDRLVLAVHETVVNARQHGLPPVLVRGWTSLDRIVVTVADSGPGPADPLAGLLPPDQPGARTGLWLANELCAAVDLSNSPDGFTVRLTATARTAR